MHRAEDFCRLQVRDRDDEVKLDLVADPVPLAEAPVPFALGEATIRIDTPHQILVNKLCALLSRNELRDLVDVKALLQAGGDLRRALSDAPKQDAGFSPLTFAWVLRGFPVTKLAVALGWSPDDAAAVERFRDDLIEQILAEAAPSG